MTNPYDPQLPPFEHVIELTYRDSTGTVAPIFINARHIVHVIGATDGGSIVQLDTVEAIRGGTRKVIQTAETVAAALRGY